MTRPPYSITFNSFYIFMHIHTHMDLHEHTCNTNTQNAMRSIKTCKEITISS